jgi:hypothetical protein
MATLNPTEISIHESGRQGSLVAREIKARLEKRSGIEVGFEKPDLTFRTDIFYVEGAIRKACEIKYSNTSPVCRQCKQFPGANCQCMHPFGNQDLINSNPQPKFIPTHKNCHNRFKEAIGNCLSWQQKNWTPHFLYIDLANQIAPGYPCRAKMTILPIMQQAGFRVMTYDHIPRAADYIDIIDWIRAP